MQATNNQYCKISIQFPFSLSPSNSFLTLFLFLFHISFICLDSYRNDPSSEKKTDYVLDVVGLSVKFRNFVVIMELFHNLGSLRQS